MARVFSFLLFLALVFAVSAEKKSYKGYQVIRILHSETLLSAAGHQEQIDSAAYDFSIVSLAVYEVAEAHLLDVWAANAVEGWIDVMIPPLLVNSTSDLFSFVPFTVKIADVQQSIDESEADQKRSVQQGFFSRFQPYAAITTWLNQQAGAHSDVARVFSIGSSYIGNAIYGLELKKAGSNNPVVVIHCGIHAREWISPSSCCWMIDQILNGGPDEGSLLEDFELVIIPVLNIDGYAYTQTNDRLWRKNRQPHPTSTCVGTDLNRNYETGWSGPGASSNPCAETYFGTAAFSGVEAKVISDLLKTYKAAGRLISYWDIHAYSALWMSPWGYTCTGYPADYEEMRLNMQAATNAVRAENGNTYRFGDICRTIYQASGGSTDYSYDKLQVVHSYAVEAYGTSFTPPISYIPLIGSEIYAGVKASIKLYKQ